MKILEDFAKCQTTAAAEKFCSLPGNDVCFPYKLTRDQRTQVPRWNDPGNEQVHLSDADRCKKIYLNFDLVNLFHPHCKNRKGIKGIHQSNFLPPINNIILGFVFCTLLTSQHETVTPVHAYSSCK